MKHLCRVAEDKRSNLTSGDILNGVCRNFGGICRDANERMMKAFENKFPVKYPEKPQTLRMIRENLRSRSLER